MRAEQYFITSAEVVDWPFSFEQFLLDAIHSNCKWFVIKSNGKLIGCVRREDLAKAVKETGFANISQLSLDRLIVDALVVYEEDEEKHLYEENKVIILTNKQGDVKGVIDWEIGNRIHELVAQDRWLIKEMQTVFYEFYHNIFVTDEKGTVIRVTSEDDQKFLGKNVFDLEKERFFYPSMTAKVLQSGMREKGLQYNRTGGVFMIDSIPIKNDEGEIVRVVSITKDSSEIGKLTKQLYEIQTLLDNYREQVTKIQQKRAGGKPFLFGSKLMETLYDMIKSVASVDTSVLLLGETGVGKQMVANQIHQLSYRKDKPFITVNCGAIPENLLESELFGYEEGAFSGAKKGGKPGIFELADKGTVFLDEIGELPLHLQVKLLRVLQERVIMKVGGTQEKQVDVRIITATNQNLEKMVKEHLFREDLYYRINIVPIQIPPLRERKEDIHVLAYHFLATYNQKYAKDMKLTNEHMKHMLRYPWPGNVRELENRVERYVVTGQPFFYTSAESSILSLDSLEEGEIPKLRGLLDEVERKVLTIAFRKYKTTREMAKCLGLNQSTIVRKLQKYDIGK